MLRNKKVVSDGRSISLPVFSFVLEAHLRLIQSVDSIRSLDIILPLVHNVSNLQIPGTKVELPEATCDACQLCKRCGIRLYGPTIVVQELSPLQVLAFTTTVVLGDWGLGVYWFSSYVLKKKVVQRCRRWLFINLTKSADAGSAKGDRKERAISRCESNTTADYAIM